MKKILTILVVLAISTTPKLAVSIPSDCVEWNDIHIEGESLVCPNSGYYTYYVQNNSGVPILEYHWEVPTGFTIVSQSGNSMTVTTGNDVDLQTIEVYIRTDCGSWQGQWFFGVGQQSGC